LEEETNRVTGSLLSEYEINSVRTGHGEKGSSATRRNLGKSCRPLRKTESSQDRGVKKTEGVYGRRGVGNDLKSLCRKSEEDHKGGVVGGFKSTGRRKRVVNLVALTSYRNIPKALRKRQDQKMD